MADDLPIVVSLNGAEEAAAKLQKLGEAADSVKKVGEAVEYSEGTLKAMQAAADRLGVSLDEYKAKVEAAAAAATASAAAHEAQADAVLHAANEQKKAAEEAKKLEEAHKSLNDALEQVSRGGIINLVGGLQKLIEHFVGAESAAAKFAVRAVESVVGLAAFADRAGAAAERLVHHAQSIGLTVEAYERLSFIASQTGTSMTAFERAFRSIETAAESAIRSGDKSSGTFKKLGVDLVDSSGHAKEAGTVLETVFNNAAASGNAAAYVMAAFGKRGGGELAEAANLGAAGIKTLENRFKELGLGIDSGLLDSGRELHKEFLTLGEATSKFGEKIGLALSPAFTEIARSIAEGIAAITPAAVEAAKVVGGILKDSFSGLIGVLSDLKPWLASTFEGIKKIVQDTGLDQLLVGQFKDLEISENNIAGADFREQKIAEAANEALKLKAKENKPERQQFDSAGNYTGRDPAADAAQKAFDAVQKGQNSAASTANSAVAAVVDSAAADAKIRDQLRKTNESADSAEQKAQELFDKSVAGASDEEKARHGITPGGGAGGIDTRDSIDRAGDSLAEATEKAEDSRNNAARTAAAELEKLATSAAAAASSFAAIIPYVQEGGRQTDSEPSEGFAGGGEVHGPGSSTSDSIPARLSRGEFVINAGAVARHGSSFFHSINSRAPGFALGGPIGSVSAGGGMGLHPVSINFDGSKISGLHASPDAVRQLTQVSVSRQSAAAGRRPSWDR